MVELLVVITIIGILISLVAAGRAGSPRGGATDAVQQQSETTGVGALNHEQAQGFLPTDGWGFSWIGDPDRGFGQEQPGGWVYNVLPYLEQQALHDLPLGKSASTTPSRTAAAAQMIGTPLAVLYCPSRRAVAAYPAGVTSWGFFKYGNPMGYVAVSEAARSDYAINGGDYYTDPSYGPFGDASGPADIPSGESAAAIRGLGKIASLATGVAYCGSQVRMAEVSDGSSNTYLIGEKYLSSDNYTNGQMAAIMSAPLMGDNGDICRWTLVAYPPHQDRPGDFDCYSFGSATPADSISPSATVLSARSAI